MTHHTHLRKLAAVAAVAFSTVALGGCFELGNGEGPNCDEATITGIEDAIAHLESTNRDLAEQNESLANTEDDSETPIINEADVAQAQIALNEGIIEANEGLIDAKYALLDACDAPTITES